jgi:hypothetical protein
VIAASTTRTGRRILAIAAAASLSLALVAPAFAAEPVIGPGGIPPTTTTVTVFHANSGGTVNIPQNGVVRIVLPYNPSTGFHWVTAQAPDPTMAALPRRDRAARRPARQRRLAVRGPRDRHDAARARLRPARPRRSVRAVPPLRRRPRHRRRADGLLMAVPEESEPAGPPRVHPVQHG